MARGQYDDAWETPGWTAQNMAYPPSDLQIVQPPTGLKNLNLVGDFFDQNGLPLYTILTITPSVRLLKVGGSQVILRPFLCQTHNGVLQNISVVQPDVGSDCAPSTWTYHIRQRSGPVIREYDLTVPQASDVDVFNLATEDGVTVIEDFPLLRDYVLPQGATFRKTFLWTQPGGSPNLTTWTAKAEVKTVSGTVLSALTLTETSGIVLGSGGLVEFAWDDSQTVLLTDDRYLYSLELYQPGPGGDTIRFVSGNLHIDHNDVI